MYSPIYSIHLTVNSDKLFGLDRYRDCCSLLHTQQYALTLISKSAIASFYFGLRVFFPFLFGEQRQTIQFKALVLCVTQVTTTVVKINHST